MVSDSNKFVLIRSEGRGSVGKQLVLLTASTYQLLVKVKSSHGCNVSTVHSNRTHFNQQSLKQTAQVGRKTAKAVT